MDVVIAGGVQTMSSVPISSAMLAGQPLGFNDPFSGSEGWVARYGDGLVTQFRSAQMIADKWQLSREAMEAFSLNPIVRPGRLPRPVFCREILPYQGLTADETIRDTSLKAMAELQPLQEGGTITAAVSSQTCDGASAVLVVSEEALARYKLTPRARVVHDGARRRSDMDADGAYPCHLGRAVERSGIALGDIDLVEINEAFAPVPMAWLAETGYPHEQTNVNGGAIALGHPLGATGTKLMTTLLHEMERREVRYGLQTMCEGGGQANVTILERL